MARFALIAVAASLAVGCSLLNSFDGLSGAVAVQPEGGVPTDGGVVVNADADADGDASTRVDAAAAPAKAVVVVGGFLPGGGFTPKETAFVAPLLDDGGLGEWKPSALPVKSSYWSGFAASVGGEIFVVGSASSFIGSIGSTGVLTWAVEEGLERESFCTVASGDELFVIGGKDAANSVLDTVSVVRTSSKPLVLTSTTPLPGERHVLAGGCAATEKFVYVASGKNGAGVHQDQVWMAPRLPTGGVGSWTATTSIPSIAFAVHLVALNSRLVLVGGSFDFVDSKAVYSARIGSDGTLGPWQLGTALPAADFNYTVSATDERIFVIGGESGGTQVLTTTIDVAGVVAPWTATSALPDPRAHAGSAIITLP